MHQSVSAGPIISQQIAESHKRDFWIKENQKSALPYFRLRKCGRIVAAIAGGREGDLLDVGCGTATLMCLLPENIHYFGIDIAIHNPADNLREADILQTPIAFDDMKFDLVVAQGLFEYVGSQQSEKFREIAQVLRPDGTFIVSYTNFGHRDSRAFEAYSNIRPLRDFRADLDRSFRIRRSFPAAHNWYGGQPRGRAAVAVNMPVTANIPFFSPKLAVEYFFVCSAR